MPPLAAQGLRVAAVVAALAAAAALATPPGRLPLALRGLARLFGAKPAGAESRVPVWKRILALSLVVVAAALCCLA